MKTCLYQNQRVHNRSTSNPKAQKRCLMEASHTPSPHPQLPSPFTAARLHRTSAPRSLRYCRPCPLSRSAVTSNTAGRRRLHERPLPTRRADAGVPIPSCCAKPNTIPKLITRCANRFLMCETKHRILKIIGYLYSSLI